MRIQELRDFRFEIADCRLQIDERRKAQRDETANRRNGETAIRGQRTELRKLSPLTHYPLPHFRHFSTF